MDLNIEELKTKTATELGEFVILTHKKCEELEAENATLQAENAKLRGHDMVTDIDKLIEELRVLAEACSLNIIEGDAESFAKAADTIAAQQKRIEELKTDANKWRALVGCDRIRTVGRTLDYNHLGIELWNEHPAKHPCTDYPQDGCREHLERFVAKALSSNGGSDDD